MKRTLLSESGKERAGKALGAISGDAGHNDQFKNGNIGEVNLILLDLAH
jgi:hypothetical protein